MGQAGQKPAQPADDADRNVDARRFFDLLYDTASEHQPDLPNSASGPDQTPIPPAGADNPQAMPQLRPRHAFTSAVPEPEQDAGAVRPREAAPRLQTERFGAPSPALQPDQGRRVKFVLASLLVGTGLATAWWFGLVRWPLSPANSNHVEVALKPGHHPRRAAPLEAAAPPTDRVALIARDQKGLANEPVPLGISLQGSAGGETVILDNLVDGTQVSLGSPLSPSRWSLPAKDLGEAFIGPPKNFSGKMEVRAKLYSSDNELLESKTIRFEWTPGENQPQAAHVAASSSRPSVETPSPVQAPAPIHRATASGALPGIESGSPPRGDSLRSGSGAPTAANKVSAALDLAIPSQPPEATRPSTTAPAQPAPAKPITRSLPPDEIETLLQSGERLLKQGDMASARISLRRAAEAGSAEAALDLGMSYDPAFLPRGIGVATAADVARATEWYTRAMQLGLTDVSRYLQRLATMPNPQPRR